jgi:hypothetical protein
VADAAQVEKDLAEALAALTAAPPPEKPGKGAPAAAAAPVRDTAGAALAVVAEGSACGVLTAGRAAADGTDQWVALCALAAAESASADLAQRCLQPSVSVLRFVGSV